MQISAAKIPLEKFDLNYLRGPDGKLELHSGLDWTVFFKGGNFFLEWGGCIIFSSL